MCLSDRDLPPPDPWEEFIYEVVWPFVTLNAKVAVAMLALVVLTGLIVGLFGQLSTRERRVCGVLPLSLGVAAFIAVVAHHPRWWAFHSEAQNTLLACAFCIGMLGLLVVERRSFISDDG